MVVDSDMELFSFSYQSLILSQNKLKDWRFSSSEFDLIMNLELSIFT